jgi:lipoprotein NlpD
MKRNASAFHKALLAAAALAVVGGCSGALNLPASHRPSSYLVHRGDTLYSIAWHYGLDYHTVAHWNHIPPPYTIYPGQRVYLYPGRTAAAAQTPAHAPARSVAAKQPAPSPKPQPVSAGRPAPTAGQVTAAGGASAAPASNAPIAWQWPATGNVHATFGQQDLPGKGVVIEGHLGEPVVAAASGTVVYSGNALVGYGNLVIVKHNDEWLSAYGQNQRLLVHEGDQVHGGEKIATMGLAPDGKPELYFEIRNNGDPVDPLRFLPKPR